MSKVGSELNQLLADEIEQRLALFASNTTKESELRAALHLLKGSAAMAGYAELSLVINQLSARLREHDTSVGKEALELLDAVAKRLRSDLPPFETAWPVPPPALRPTSVDARYRGDYDATVRDRLAELDLAISDPAHPLAGLERAKLSVHALKGAAAAVGAEITAWYCHGLETHLRSVPRVATAASEVLNELARHRALLALLHEDPTRALDALRASVQLRWSEIPPTPRRPRVGMSNRAPLEQEPEREPPLKIPTEMVEAFSERLERFVVVEDELYRSAELARQLGITLRDVQNNLRLALRQLRRQRQYIADRAALERIESAVLVLRANATGVHRGARLLRSNADALHARTSEMQTEVAELRRTTMRTVFDRVEHALRRLSTSEGKLVQVVQVGADVAVDKRISERLLDPLMQLARNAIAHGIEAPEQRRAAGKSIEGVIWLRAERIGEWLRIVIEDDGRGADVQRIRELAIARGAVSQEVAARAHENDLLALLFLPGLTTHERADLLAGRGLGLDLTQDAVRRLGGAIHLRSRAGGGLIATLEVPSEFTFVDVLWLEELGHEFALPVSYTGRVEINHSPETVRLGSCLGLVGAATPPLRVELKVYGVDAIWLGIDGFGSIEEATLRPIPRAVASAGPYSGAILKRDGSLKLALDAPLVAARAWSLGSPAYA